MFFFFKVLFLTVSSKSTLVIFISLMKEPLSVTRLGFNPFKVIYGVSTLSALGHQCPSQTLYGCFIDIWKAILC